MLSPSKMNVLQGLVAGSSKEELAWINGYLTALLSKENAGSGESLKLTGNKITIAYGTETGNAKKLATDFASKAKKSGLNPKLVNLDQYRMNDFSKEEYFFTVISTQGDGEPPEGAKKFYDHIHNNGFTVKGLKYGVLALGDTSYPLFCKAGEDVDQQLCKLGGERFVPLQKCDTDYEAEAETWIEGIINHLVKQNPRSEQTTSTSKKRPGRKTYDGEVLTNINLNDLGSLKQTHHIEIISEELDYEPGDALGIIPENPINIVESILSLLQLEEGSSFTYKNERVTCLDLLKSKLNIVFLSEKVIAKYGALVGQNIPSTKIGLLDLLRIYPLKNTGSTEQLMEILEPITPRLYSIASSPIAHEGEIHITVARDSFCINGEIKYGLCSDYFSQLKQGSKFRFYIHKNSQFRLPDEDKDLIMVGPGTGIAPFRSFIAHRDAKGSSGRNWLFFGDQHFVTDFLYQTEWLNWLETGTLTRLDVAFSRDQKEKVYVQHKMLKNARDIYDWLQNGASFYICGAKNPMSVDVENALLSIIKDQGCLDEDQAIEYLEQLKEEGRFIKDVY